MQHLVAFLLLMQRNGSYLLIEKGAFAWYYVITEGEQTRTTKQTKEEKIMITTIVAGAVAGAVGLGLGYLGIYLFTKI